MSTARVVHLDDVSPIAVDGDDVPRWTPLRRLLGVAAFGINAWTAAAAGEHCVEPHDEGDEDDGGHEEVYVVLRGAADFTAGDATFPVRAGSVVFLHDPAVHRSAIATEAGTTVLAIGATPGEAFTPSDWEERWLRELGVELAQPREISPG